jgi:outer membrane protein TolC
LAEADVQLSRNRVELGTAVVSDLLAAEVQLSEVRQQQIEAEGEEVTALAALNTAMGMGIETPQIPSGQLGARTFPLESQEGLLQQALQHRPEVVRAGLAWESGQVGVRGARSEYLPRVDLFTSAGASRHDWLNGSGDYTVGVSVTFQLFDAGRSSRVAQARAAAEMASGERDHLQQQVRYEVVEARQRVRTAAERMVVAERTTERATEALRIVQDRYREGLTTMTELLRAQTALTRARLQVLATRYDYYVGYAALLLTTGRLTGVEPFVS